ncbi:MAG: 16S rRNA (guanine(966)-N(2))-methyltransferase RsmD [Candidatus Gastranaerophilaceae bacterium]
MNITGGKYNSLNIKTANFSNIKPTLSKIRQAVFNTLSSLGEFKTFCDVFAGSGIMSFEAISRDFDVISIEIDKRSADFIIENSKNLKIPINLKKYDAIKFLKQTDLTFDVFYLDPPYQSGLYEKALKEIFSRNLLNKNGIIILEKPTKLDVETKDFDLIKEKIYADKSIIYLKNK